MHLLVPSGTLQDDQGSNDSRGIVKFTQELGFKGVSIVVHFGNNGNAFKSCLCRRGFGKMRHLEIRDLWLQIEVAEMKVEVRGEAGRF